MNFSKRILKNLEITQIISLENQLYYMDGCDLCDSLGIEYTVDSREFDGNCFCKYKCECERKYHQFDKNICRDCLLKLEAKRQSTIECSDKVFCEYCSENELCLEERSHFHDRKIHNWREDYVESENCFPIGEICFNDGEKNPERVQKVSDMIISSTKINLMSDEENEIKAYVSLQLN